MTSFEYNNENGWPCSMAKIMLESFYHAPQLMQSTKTIITAATTTTKTEHTYETAVNERNMNVVIR